jgi:predicted Zn-dependent protease with MMP-like domain
MQIGNAMKVTTKEFAQLVRDALADLPAPFDRSLQDVAIDVEPIPDEETLRAMEIDEPSEILGLYHGLPLTERGLEAVPELPDRIVLYQRNLEGMCETREEMIHEIRVTVLHEIGHHFGLDEEDLEELGYD